MSDTENDAAGLSPAEDVRRAVTGFVTQFKGFAAEIETKLQQTEERMNMLDRKTMTAARPPLAGAVHFFTVSVITTTPGFASAKMAASAVSDALHDADLTLTRGRLVSLRFESGAARRIDEASARQIDLRFRARVQDD